MENEKNDLKKSQFRGNFAKMVGTFLVFLILGVILNHYVRMKHIKVTFKVAWVLLCFGIVHFAHSETLAQVYHYKPSEKPSRLDSLRKKLSPPLLRRIGQVVIFFTGLLLIDILLIALKMAL
jgi:hypothetical protein